MSLITKKNYSQKLKIFGEIYFLTFLIESWLQKQKKINKKFRMLSFFEKKMDSKVERKEQKKRNEKFLKLRLLKNESNFK